MIIGFIGFGKVSKRLNDIFKLNNIETVVSTENRSDKTIERINNSNVLSLKTDLEVSQISDILISANSPSQALDVAIKYGTECKGIFIDLNNISPDTTLEIGRNLDNFIDAAIIGNVEREKLIFVYCGEKLSFLEDLPIKVHHISDNIGDASKLKLLRSTYTKSLTAVLIESLDLAKKNNLENEFFDILTLTEGKNFKESSLSRVRNTINNKNRKEEEIEEIINYFTESDLTIIKAVLTKFRKI